MPIGGEEVVENTYGLMLFQEQIMLFCQKLADFNLEKCDSVRKVLGKNYYRKQRSTGMIS